MQAAALCSWSPVQGPLASHEGRAPLLPPHRFLSEGNSYLDCGHPCEQNMVHLRDHQGLDHLVLADMGCRWVGVGGWGGGSCGCVSCMCEGVAEGARFVVCHSWAEGMEVADDISDTSNHGLCQCLTDAGLAQPCSAGTRCSMRRRSRVCSSWPACCVRAAAATGWSWWTSQQSTWSPCCRATGMCWMVGSCRGTARTAAVSCAPACLLCMGCISSIQEQGAARAPNMLMVCAQGVTVCQSTLYPCMSRPRTCAVLCSPELRSLPRPGLPLRPAQSQGLVDVAGHAARCQRQDAWSVLWLPGGVQGAQLQEPQAFSSAVGLVCMRACMVPGSVVARACTMWPAPGSTCCTSQDAAAQLDGLQGYDSITYRSRR